MKELVEKFGTMYENGKAQEMADEYYAMKPEEKKEFVLALEDSDYHNEFQLSMALTLLELTV